MKEYSIYILASRVNQERKKKLSLIQINASTFGFGEHTFVVPNHLFLAENENRKKENGTVITRGSQLIAVK